MHVSLSKSLGRNKEYKKVKDRKQNEVENDALFDHFRVSFRAALGTWRNEYPYSNEVKTLNTLT